jgi:hypothetical protein
MTGKFWAETTSPGILAAGGTTGGGKISSIEAVEIPGM